MDELPQWFDLVAVQQPWALLMILPSLIVGITATWSVFKLKGVSKAGFKVASTKNKEKKGTGDERLETDDLLLNEVGVEGSKGKEESKTLNSEASNPLLPKSDNRKKPDPLDPNWVEKGMSSEDKKGVTNTVSRLKETKSESKISDPQVSTDLYGSLGDDLSPTISTKNFPNEDKKDVKSVEIACLFSNLVDGELKPNSSQLDKSSNQTLNSIETYESEKKKPYPEDLNLLTNSVASSVQGSGQSSYSGEKDDVGKSYQLETKKPIRDFDPDFVKVTPERKLNIGRSRKEKKTEDSPSYFLEKSDSEESSSSIPPVDTPKKADTSRTHISSTDDTARTISSVCAIPDLISTQRSTSSNKHYDFNAIQSLINATKDGENYGDKYSLSNLNKPKIHAKPFPVDVIDPLSIPGYTPSISERPILPKDFIKLTEPAAITSYDLVPGPPLLKAVSNVWKYFPLLGTQLVSSLIYSVQALISSCDKKLKYPYMYPYYYLLNKYGPMVRLHGPIGADILVMAVNGQDLPVVHIKTKANKRQSLFDSLNTYRKDATPLSYMINFSANSKRIPDNPTLQIDQHFTSLERITDDFLKRKKFTRSYTGAKEDENHGKDLLKWAMQCTMDVYFKTKKDFLDQTDCDKIVDCFIKVSKSVRLCETGIQLWRIFPTLTWLDLTDQCKEMDRFIINEVSHCVMNTNLGKGSGSVVEVLLTTDELRTTDLLTPLLDLLVINVNMAANLAGFLLYNLSKSPQSQRALFREVSNVIPKGKTNIEQADLAKMKYLNACITETLRLVPPIPFLSRQIDEDTRIHNFKIPKGTYIQMVNVLPCSRGDLCFDDVGRFQAERWTEKTTSLGGDPLMGLPQWQSSPKFNRELVITQVSLLVSKVVRECRLEYPNTEVYADGMVLQGPSTPFNFSFIERVL